MFIFNSKCYKTSFIHINVDNLYTIFTLNHRYIIIQLFIRYKIIIFIFINENYEGGMLKEPPGNTPLINK